MYAPPYNGVERTDYKEMPFSRFIFKVDLALLLGFAWWTLQDAPSLKLFGASLCFVLFVSVVFQRASLRALLLPQFV